MSRKDEPKVGSDTARHHARAFFVGLVDGLAAPAFLFSGEFQKPLPREDDGGLADTWSAVGDFLRQAVKSPAPPKHG